MSEEIRKIQEKVTPVLKRYGIARAAVFGSVARGDNRPDSDVDVLVEMPGPYGLFKFMDIKLALEEVLGKKVDLVEYGAIKPVIRDNIISEQVRIL